MRFTASVREQLQMRRIPIDGWANAKTIRVARREVKYRSQLTSLTDLNKLLCEGLDGGGGGGAKTVNDLLLIFCTFKTST